MRNGSPSFLKSIILNTAWRRAATTVIDIAIIFREHYHLRRYCVMEIRKSCVGKRVICVIAASFLASTFVITWTSPLGAAEHVKVVKVGAVLPMTGPLAPFGETSKRGLQLAAEEVNASGGINSLGGAVIELVIGDTQSQPDKAVSVAEQLISEGKVHLLTGAIQSAATIASSQVSERMKIPYIIATSTADQQTERGFKFVFQVSGKSDWIGRDQVEFLDYFAKVLGKKLSRIGLFYEDSEYGQTLARAQKKYLQQKGYQIVADVSYPARTPEMDSFVLKLKAGNPDVILPASYPGDAILLVKTLNKLGYKVPIVGSGAGFVDTSFLLAVGPLGEGILTIDVWSQAVPAARAMMEKYKGKYGTEPDAQAITNYQTMLVMAEALQQARSVDNEAIRKALSDIMLTGPKVVLPMEKIRFDEKGQNGFRFTISQIRHGTLVTVWPEKFSTGKITFAR